MNPPRPDVDDRSLHTLLLDIYQKLGRVEAQNDFIIKAQGDAVESRKAIHEKLEDFGMIAVTVRRLEPIVVNLEGLRREGVGAGKLASVLSRAVYAIVGAAIAVAGWLAAYWTIGKH